MTSRALLSTGAALVFFSGLWVRVAHAQAPIACYSVSYSPDSLNRYLPPRVKLLPSRRRYWRIRRVAKWEAPEGWSDASEIMKLTRGYAAWWQRSDSLHLEVGEAVTAMPWGRIDLGITHEGERTGTLYLDFGGSELPPHATGIAHARRFTCPKPRGGA